jgi:hypothetical protein
MSANEHDDDQPDSEDGIERLRDELVAKAREIAALHASRDEWTSTAVERGLELEELRDEIAALRAEFDAQVNLLKACEHIADGDEGWERLRNECPSTAAVARLRDALKGDGKPTSSP